MPGDSGPCGATLTGCDVNVPGGPGTVTGYGGPNLGPLFPGDPSTGDICGPVGTVYAGECINKVNQNVSTSEPSGIALLGMGLLGLGLLARRTLGA